MTGGMKAVLWTEGMQTPLMLIGSLIILVRGLAEVGGLEGLRAANPRRSISGARCRRRRRRRVPRLPVRPERDAVARRHAGLADHRPVVLVHRSVHRPAVLTAKNVKEARRGTLWAGYLKLFPIFIFLLPGMIAVALKQQGVAGFAEMVRPDEAFPRLVSYLLPDGLRGLVLAGMLAALMSSLASLFNSTATLFTVDFYRHASPVERSAPGQRRPRRPVAVVGAGMAWIPFLQSLGSGSLYGYLQLVQSLLAPSIAAVFMLGIFSRHVSPMSGLVGISAIRPRHGPAGAHRRPRCGVIGGPLGVLAEVNWLYFSFLLFVFTCVLIVVVSLVTPAAAPEKLANLTFGTITRGQPARRRRLRRLGDRHSIVILAIIAGVYVVFWSRSPAGRHHTYRPTMFSRMFLRPDGLRFTSSRMAASAMVASVAPSATRLAAPATPPGVALGPRSSRPRPSAASASTPSSARASWSRPPT